MVRRTLVERVVLAAVRDRLADQENLDYVFGKLAHEVAAASTATPEAIRLKEAEFDAEQRRVANFIEFVAEGRGSRALADALTASEKRLEDFRADLDGLRRSRNEVFSAPPREWLAERMMTIQTVLERRTQRSALLLRKLLGTIRMEPVTPEIGRPYYRALSHLDALAIVEIDPDSPDSEPGSNSLQWWRRRESNPCERCALAGRQHARGDTGHGLSEQQLFRRAQSLTRQHVHLNQIERVNHRRAVVDTLGEPRPVRQQRLAGRQLGREVPRVFPFPLQAFHQRRRRSPERRDVASPDEGRRLGQCEAKQTQVATE